MAQSPSKVLKDIAPVIKIAPRKYRNTISLIIIGIAVVAAIVLPNVNSDNDSGPSPTSLPAGMYQVARVVDGDTLLLRLAARSRLLDSLG